MDALMPDESRAYVQKREEIHIDETFADPLDFILLEKNS